MNWKINKSIEPSDSYKAKMERYCEDNQAYRIYTNPNHPKIKVYIHTVSSYKYITIENETNTILSTSNAPMLKAMGEAWELIDTFLTFHAPERITALNAHKYLHVRDAAYVLCQELQHS